MEYRNYKAKIYNATQKKDITDFVNECDISFPNASLISSMEAKFVLDEKLINIYDEVKIKILNENNIEIFSLSGKASIPKRSKLYTGVEKWEYSIKNSYEKLFDRVIPASITYYDLYMCNVNDKENSLLHIIAKNLGFSDEQIRFNNVSYDDGRLMKVPFIYFEENSRWIDKLQAFIEATDGILFIYEEKLFFTPRNNEINSVLNLDRTNIITSIEETSKEILQNGIKIPYDRFERLENQTVFNLSSKIITEPNTILNDDVPTMRIQYITSAVANPTLTKATGYYFTTDDPNSKVDINLKENVHYKIISLKETGVEVKFINPLNYKLYIDNFEIKGTPLAKYENNEINVMFKSVKEKNQENLITLTKSTLIQTKEQALFVAKRNMQKKISNNKEYNFKTKFLSNLALGQRYNLNLEDIQTVVEIEDISISLKPKDFTMRIKAVEVKNDIGDVKISHKLAGNSQSSYIDLTNVEKSIEKNKQELKTVQADIRSKLHKMETTPTENVAENDIWLNPETNVWKKYYNGVWNNISDDEILPAMKMYNSVDTNVIKLQGTADKVGVYLLNDGEKMGSLNGELAHTTFDKLGQFESVNPNNKVALNIKDPANPSRVNSKILLGVTDVNDPKWNDVIFAVGDEASPARIEFKNGQLTQTVNGEKLGAKLNNVDKNISNLSKGISDSLNTAKSYADTKKTEAINSSKTYSDTKKTEAINSANGYTNTKKSEIDKEIGNLSKGISDNLNTAKDYADTKKTEAINTSKSYADSKKTEIENSLKKEITFEVGGEANKYYPVLFNSTNKECKLVIYRRYNEKAPNTWNTATRKGALFLELTTNFYGYWSGNSPSVVVNKFDTSYSIPASKIEITNASGLFVWLRGGGAVYHAYCDDYEVNNNLTATPYINGFDSSVLGGSYALPQHKFTLSAGTFEQTGSASSIKALFTLEQIKEVHRMTTNADGRLTTLQNNYNNTVKDITSFKTVTSNEIDTVKGALEQGNFVITGNTTFDGSARFVSQGTNEVITIANGAIEFHRNGKKLTRIKNIRYGVINTDSKGKGIVNFDGFKQPMLIFPSIKGANFGKNMASIFCYAEHIKDTQYRFYVGGTNEHYTEAKPIKVVGTEWAATNAVKTTLLEMTGTFKESEATYPLQSFKEEYKQYNEFKNKANKVLKVPKFNVKIIRVDGIVETIVYSQDYTVSYSLRGTSNISNSNAWYGKSVAYYKLHKTDFTKAFNLLKTYSSRINVKFKVAITVLEPNFTIERYYTYSETKGGSDNKETFYYSAKYVGTLKTITMNDFIGLSITASSDTSTLSDVTGTGEVQYIAMEVD